MSKKMTVTPHILTYIGSKGRMAEVISSMIPKGCTTYAELFCGSAAVALNSRKFDVKILNDYNASISNFWKVTTEPATREKLLKELQKTTYSRSLFEDAKIRKEEYGANRTDIIQWAVDTYVLNMQSFNADGSNWIFRDADKYERRLKDPTGLPLAFKTLEGQAFRVYNETAIDCMEQENLLENPKVFMFLDPPYLEGLRCDGKLYEVDMPGVRDHIELLYAIRSAKSKIVLSGYWSGRDDGTDLYDGYLIPAGWHRHLLGEYTKGCEIGEKKSKGAEWVWCNYDLEKEAPAALAGLDSYCAEKKSPCLMEWLAVQSADK